MRARLGPPMTLALRFTAAMACISLGLVACGTDSPSTGPNSQPATTQEASSAPQTEATTDAPIMSSTGPENKTAPPSGAAQLVPIAMRVGSHAGYDRVVIELQGEGTPGWSVDYTDHPAQQASGTAVDYIGDNALMVTIQGVLLPFEMGITDPDLSPVTGDGPVVKQVQSLGSFEGSAQFVIGVAGDKPPYSVEVLDNPKRLVIDVRHS